jgi:hypothetical protein
MWSIAYLQVKKIAFSLILLLLLLIVKKIIILPFRILK